VDFRSLLDVLRDPDSGGAPNEIALQTAMLVDLAQDIGTSGNLYASIDNIRGQLATTIDRAAKLDPALMAAADSVEHKFASLADSLTQQQPGAFYERPVKLIAQLSYLASEVQSSDRKPTDQAHEAHAVLKAELRLVQREYAALVEGDITRLNARFRARGLSPVIVAQP